MKKNNTGHCWRVAAILGGGVDVELPLFLDEYVGNGLDSVRKVCG